MSLLGQENWSEVPQVSKSGVSILVVGCRIISPYRSLVTFTDNARKQSIQFLKRDQGLGRIIDCRLVAILSTLQLKIDERDQ